MCVNKLPIQIIIEEISYDENERTKQIWMIERIKNINI